MNRIFLVLSLGMAIFCWAMPDDDQSSQGLLIVLQQDLRPAINNLDFEQGFGLLIRRLPPEQEVEVYGFHGVSVFPLLTDFAATLDWPPRGFDFVASSPRTSPFQNLLAILNHRGIHDQAVYFISNCRDEALLNEVALPPSLIPRHGPSGASAATTVPSLMLEKQMFDPSRYPQLNELRQYCRQHRVRIIGFMVRDMLPTGLHNIPDPTVSSSSSGSPADWLENRCLQQMFRDRVGYTALQWLTSQTGGLLVADITSFSKAFENLP